MFIKRIIFIKFLLIFIISCSGTRDYVVKYGNHFDPGLILNIEPGRSTKEDIMDMFGVPLQKDKKGGHKESWNYNYIVVKKGLRGLFYKPVEKKLIIDFYKDNVLHYKYDEFTF
ncbi:MAG: hypothetical protein SV062_09745 [Thermodesulfobacteriota bacterium]|nr:hypothetical protein [Thermodesulfobacteriota bacterium]